MSKNSSNPQKIPPAIILFDGICNLCNASVNFILDRDRQRAFQFAALQSEAGKRLMAGNDMVCSDSVVLIDGSRIYTESTAILRICMQLGMPWRLLAFFIIVPRFVRDPIYRWVARHRYRWFGKRDACRIPSPEWQDRFL